MPIVLNGTTGQITGTSLSGIDTGKILQVVSTSDANSILQGQVTVPTTNGSSTNVVELPNISISITPSATTSKILLSVNLFGEGNYHDEAFIVNIKRAISGGSDTYIPSLMDTVVGGARPCSLGTPVHGYGGTDNETTPATFNYSNLVDAPSTTSAITYSIVMRTTASSNKTWDYNRTTNTENAYNRERGKSIMTAMELAA